MQFEKIQLEIASPMATLPILNEYVSTEDGMTTLKHMGSLKRWMKYSGCKVVHEVRRVLID